MIKKWEGDGYYLFLKTFKILPPRQIQNLFFIFYLQQYKCYSFRWFLLERSSFTSKISSLTTNIGKHTESSMYEMTF